LRIAPFIVLAPLVAAAIIGCRREPPPPPMPVENALVVTVDMAPGLPEAEDDEPATAVLRKGRVLNPGRKLHRVKWSGPVLGVKFDRDAEMIEAQFAPKGPYVYIFTPDVAEQSVPSTKLFCASKPKGAVFPQPCEDTLNRFVLGGDEAIAFLDCGQGPCPVSFAKGGRVTWSTVDGLSDLFPATVGTKRVLVTTANYMRSLAETGRKVVVLAADPTMAVIGELPLDDIDSRQKIVSVRNTILTVKGDAIELVGTHREMDQSNGKEVSNKPVRDVYKLTPDGKLARQPLPEQRQRKFTGRREGGKVDDGLGFSAPGPHVFPSSELPVINSETPSRDIGATCGPRPGRARDGWRAVRGGRGRW
jgi:hypothetical protein